MYIIIHVHVCLLLPLSLAKCLKIISFILMTALISSLTPPIVSIWYLLRLNLSDPSSGLLNRTRISVNNRACTSVRKKNYEIL